GLSSRGLSAALLVEPIGGVTLGELLALGNAFHLDRTLLLVVAHLTHDRHVPAGRPGHAGRRGTTRSSRRSPSSPRSSQTTSAPASSSSARPNPPVSRPTTGMCASHAERTSHTEAPTITACSPSTRSTTTS